MDGPELHPRRGVPPLDGGLLGRAAEFRRIDEVLAAARNGLSAALVLVGEPGIGKTSLLRYAAGAATRDMQLLGVVGAEPERQMGYAGLHRLLLPRLDRLDRLPAPQRTALGGAFGLVGGPAADRFLVGLGALTLLADVAVAAPLLCTVDDAQWLDPESLEALGFVARRLHADGIALLVTRREDDDASTAALRGLATHRVTGLSAADSRTLLARAVPGRVDEGVAGRVATETGGNPLAVLTLADELDEQQLAGHAALPLPLPTDAQVGRWFLAQVGELPPATRLLLLVAALAPPDDPATLWRAAARLGLTWADADPAVTEGVLLIGQEIAFRHPLIRSAVHTGASDADRRRVHAALAAVIPSDTDPERRAWHLAAATPGTDEAVADQLEDAGLRVRGRGGYAAWAAFLARAAELTSEPERQAGRFVASARAHLYAGNPGQAQTMLDRAAPGLGGPVVRARAEQVRAAICSYHYRMAEVPAMLLRALQEAGSVDEQLTRDLLWEAMRTAVMARQSMVGTTLAEVARATLKALADLGPGPADSDRLLHAFAVRIAVGHREAVPLFRTAIAALTGGAPVRTDAGGRVLFAVLAADELWDEDGRRTLIERVSQFDREHGDLNDLSLARRCAVAGELRAGRITEALACHHEAVDLADAMGTPATGDADLADVWAWQGRAERARTAVDTLSSVWAGTVGMGVMTTVGRQALCVLELGLGRYPEALAAALEVFEEDAAGYANRSLADLVEAGVRSGVRDAAEAGLDRLTDRATASGTPLALALLARARALMNSGDETEQLFEDAVTLLRHTGVVTELARTRLTYGEWLRRANRRTDAREQLRSCHDAFARMGADAFATRARVELLATGARVRRPDAPNGYGLTPQERQVAGLAADGATNAEIATRLFVTVSTVEYHMNKVLRKLNVTSRRQLTDVLTAAVPAGSRIPQH